MGCSGTPTPFIPGRSPRRTCAHLVSRRPSVLDACDNLLSLSQALLYEAAALGSSILHARFRPGGRNLEQLQHECSALSQMKLEILRASPEVALPVWLNLRNLGVLLALLNKRAPVACGHQTQPPVEKELSSVAVAWAEMLEAGTLNIGGYLLSPNDIDHYVLCAHENAPLPHPAKLSMWGGGAMPPKVVRQSLVFFGLWLPVHFGLPALRVYGSDNLLAQLRKNAENFALECKEAAVVAGKGKDAILLPPLLRSSDVPGWRTLLSKSSPGPCTSHPCGVNWSFKTSRVVLNED